MKHTLLSLFILSAFSAAGQSNYTDSLHDYQALYKKNLAEIIQFDTAFVRFYAPNPSYRILAKVELLKDQPFFPMRTSSGEPKQARKYAKVSFMINRKLYHLFAYQLSMLLESEEHKDNFFIPFLDAGSGASHYGGGRYLDFKTGDIKDKTLVLDFNKAYNPYCAFTSGYSCPIPPRENVVNTLVKAGEKAFAKPRE
jgi:uncharacterized protein